MGLLVTAGPPTSNGDLHLGHLSGPYLAGDIVTRYARMTGETVIYISAADDHQSYVARAARKAGRAPIEVAAENTVAIGQTLEHAGIAMDLFAAPSQSERYIAFIQKAFLTLLEGGHLAEKTQHAPFCDPCGQFLFEAHIRGACATCGAASDGGICEACGRPNNGADLVDPVCAHCGGEPSRAPLRQFWFPLEPFRTTIRRAVNMAVLNARGRALADAMLAEPLPDVPVSQPADWGIKVPTAGYEDQRISAWFELGPHYLAVTDLLPRNRPAPRGWRDSWTGLDRVVQCFGFDSTYFHTVLFPAIFHAIDPSIRPPCGFVINEFFKLDGLKFSTSRNHALWAGPFLRENNADALRYHLSLVRPETEQTNFTIAEFKDTLDRELIGAWDGWLIDLARRVAAADATGPSSSLLTRDGVVLIGRVASILSDIASCYSLEGFSPRRAAHLLSEIVRLVRDFRSALLPLEASAARDTEISGNLLAELAVARSLALAAAPMMPEFADRLWRDLGHTMPVAEARWETWPLVPVPGSNIRLSLTGYFGAAAEAHNGAQAYGSVDKHDPGDREPPESREPEASGTVLSTGAEKPQSALVAIELKSASNKPPVSEVNRTVKNKTRRQPA